MALSGRSRMSAHRSLTEGKQTCRGQPKIDVNDPRRKWFKSGALYAAGVFSLALTRVERGDPRDRDGALVTRLNYASAVEHAARSGLYCRSLAYDHPFSLVHCTPVQSAFVRNWPGAARSRGASDSTCGPSIASNPYMLTVKHQG